MECNNIDYVTFTNVQKMHATLLNSKVSKNIRNQGETLFCWAFAISTMLRQSINLFYKNFTNFRSQFSQNRNLLLDQARVLNDFSVLVPSAWH